MSSKDRSYLMSILAIAFMLISISLVIFAWVFKFDHLESASKPSEWATFSTYFSGILSPIISAGALVGLLLTLYQQQKQIEQTQKNNVANNYFLHKRELKSLATDLSSRFKVQCNVHRLYKNLFSENSPSSAYIKYHLSELEFKQLIFPKYILDIGTRTKLVDEDITDCGYQLKSIEYISNSIGIVGHQSGWEVNRNFTTKDGNGRCTVELRDNTHSLILPSDTIEMSIVLVIEIVEELSKFVGAECDFTKEWKFLTRLYDQYDAMFPTRFTILSTQRIRSLYHNGIPDFEDGDFKLFNRTVHNLENSQQLQEEYRKGRN